MHFKNIKDKHNMLNVLVSKVVTRQIMTNAYNDTTFL